MHKWPGHSEKSLRIACLIKQVPSVETSRLTAEGRLVRTGVELEMNPHCRRAVARGVELSRLTSGSCTVITLGPPCAEDVLREGVAWGADAGLLISDEKFAGSDTLATAKALAAVLRREGPFDLILVGRNSVDADTGQVGPQIAQLLDLPFLTAARKLDVHERFLQARCERDDGWLEARVSLPAVVSVAERLCVPAKVDKGVWRDVPEHLIRRISADDLPAQLWGVEASRTTVGRLRTIESQRAARTLAGPIAEQVEAAVDLLLSRGLLDAGPDGEVESVAPPVGGSAKIVVIAEPGRERQTWEMLSAAARRSAQVGGRVVAVLAQEPTEADLARLARKGADEALVIVGASAEEDVASTLIAWAKEHVPWGILAPGTTWGREVASRTAAAMDAGLTGDVVELEVSDGRLIAWKPAFGGRIVAAISATSTVQMATVRPGAMQAARSRPASQLTVTRRDARPRGRICVLGRERDDDFEALAIAQRVVAVGTGVAPDEYELLEPLRAVLSAEIACTRKVTDKGWLPHSRQVGITGRSIAPGLYVAVGLAGKFNHMIGVHGAGTVLAINSDAAAPVFADADIGIVGDWRDAVPALVAELSARSKRDPLATAAGRQGERPSA